MRGRKWECTKNSPKTQQIWHMGTPHSHVSYIFRKLFSGTAFPLQILCLYLELFKSNIASKLTILKVVTEIQRIWNYCRYAHGATPPCNTPLERWGFSSATFASQMICFYRFRVKQGPYCTFCCTIPSLLSHYRASKSVNRSGLQISMIKNIETNFFEYNRLHFTHLPEMDLHQILSRGSPCHNNQLTIFVMGSDLDSVEGQNLPSSL